METIKEYKTKYEKKEIEWDRMLDRLVRTDMAPAEIQNLVKRKRWDFIEEVILEVAERRNHDTG